MNKFKEIWEKKANTKFLRGSAKPAYIHASKQTELDCSTIQALQSKASGSLQLTFRVSINIYNLR